MLNKPIPKLFLPRNLSHSESDFLSLILWAGGRPFNRLDLTSQKRNLGCPVLALCARAGCDTVRECRSTFHDPNISTPTLSHRTRKDGPCVSEMEIERSEAWATRQTCAQHLPKLR